VWDNGRVNYSEGKPEMKIRLSMTGRDNTGHVRFKRTITEQEFAEVTALILQWDGSRPWDKVDEPDPEPVEA
jgi:hypothetical protein